MSVLDLSLIIPCYNEGQRLQNNVKQIDNNGIFNPEFHQSIDVILTQDKKDDGRIAKIIKKGYKIENKIIRPTQVKVYKYKK